MEAKPNKKVSVEGTFLLELRAKIKDLEQELRKEQKNIKNKTSELKTTKEKLTGRERQKENLRLENH